MRGRDSRGFRDRCAAVALGMVMLAGLGTEAVMAQDADDSRTTRIVVHHLDLNPRDLASYDRAMARLSEAAMQACGATPFAYGTNRSAIATSSCWQNAMRDATAGLKRPGVDLADSRPR